jgi:hypothetical protein
VARKAAEDARVAPFAEDIMAPAVEALLQADAQFGKLVGPTWYEHMPLRFIKPFEGVHQGLDGIGAYSVGDEGGFAPFLAEQLIAGGWAVRIDEAA